jgi:predicted DNA-binding protein
MTEKALLANMKQNPGMKLVNFRLTLEQIERLNQAAKSQGLKRTDLVRRGIDLAIKESSKSQNAQDQP